MSEWNPSVLRDSAQQAGVMAEADDGVLGPDRTASPTHHAAEVAAGATSDDPGMPAAANTALQGSHHHQQEQLHMQLEKEAMGDSAAEVNRYACSKLTASLALADIHCLLAA
jgi:hypothetical protein